MSSHEIDQYKLLPFQGLFSFHRHTLQANLIKNFPKYDFYDPRTWPRVAALQVKNSLGREYDGMRKLPEGIAYDRDLVVKYTSQHSNHEMAVKAVSGKSIVRSHYVQLFPYFFQAGGSMRKTGYMTADHVIAWVRPLTGMTPETGKKKASPALLVFEPTATSTSNSSSESTVASTSQRSISDSGAADIANKILEIHNAQKISTTGEVESLKHELSDVKGQLSKEKERTDYFSHLEVDLNYKASERIRGIQQDLAKEKNRADVAESTSSNATTAHCEELAEVSRELKLERSRTENLERDIAQLWELDHDTRAKIQEELENERERANMAECYASIAKTEYEEELPHYEETWRKRHFVLTRWSMM